MVPFSDKPKKKTTAGRRKIPIQKIEEKSKRHVAFSKRRMGLFKKASELSILCGSEVAVVAYSEGGKAFSFGHPSADSVIHRYLHHGHTSSSSSGQGLSSIQNMADTCLDGMGLEELEGYAHGLQMLLNMVIAKASSTQSSTSSLLVNPPPAKEEFTADVEDMLCPLAAAENFENVICPLAAAENFENVICPLAAAENFDNVTCPVAAAAVEEVEDVICPSMEELLEMERFFHGLPSHLPAEEAEFEDVIIPSLEEVMEPERFSYGLPSHLPAEEEVEYEDVIIPSLEEVMELERFFYGFSPHCV